MAGQKKLVIGASGFLGSHVTRALVERGDDVRVLLRTTSSTKAIDTLNVERCFGDIFDDTALRGAMAGCDDVFGRGRSAPLRVYQLAGHDRAAR